jgi:hypothetical protein
MNCPKDGFTLEFISGDYPTGVSSDGYHEMRYEEGRQCPKCETVYDESDVSELEEM